MTKNVTLFIEPVLRQEYNKANSDDPFAAVEWEKRDVEIKDSKGKVIFAAKQVEVPRHWDDNCLRIVAQKYFKTPLGKTERENSVRDMIHRVCDWLTKKGIELGYFDAANARNFYHEYVVMHLFNIATHNSPVWFNVGVVEKPQCHACFIQDTPDNLQGILDVANAELKLFKQGSGTGSNRSKLRGSGEKISGGGRANGPVSFIRYYCTGAGTIKSGGVSRRAAKMEILDIDHPDVYLGPKRFGQDFITVKAEEERLMRSLIRAGEDLSWDSPTMENHFPFQNCNMSVRATDSFMKAVLNDEPWKLIARTTKEITASWPAKVLMRAIANGTHMCGDPGMQFHDRVNIDNPVLDEETIVATNPCSEYCFLNETACNLTSFNLRKFVIGHLQFAWSKLKHVIRLLMIASDIIIDAASYPTEKIRERSVRFRTTGVGYGNLGALLMGWGLPYDSSAGRTYAGLVTSAMQACCIDASAELSEHFGQTDAYKSNHMQWQKVLIQMHGRHIANIEETKGPLKGSDAVSGLWNAAMERMFMFGQRNAQLSLVAPTGTIQFLLDLDTTGVEPALLHVSYKNLSGGGQIKIVNRVTADALKSLGYNDREVQDIGKYIVEKETIEGCELLSQDHLEVFDCAFKPDNGKRCIEPTGHIKMMAAVQPYLSGAISKTVNCPDETTVEEIEYLYIMAWEMKLKCVAIYRNNSKVIQAVGSGKTQNLKPDGGAATPVRVRPTRERNSRTIKFNVSGFAGYVIFGLRTDGQPCELFLEVGAGGSFVNGWAKAWAKSLSVMLQYGIPVPEIVDSFGSDRFEPDGVTDDPDIRIVPSIAAYVVRKLALIAGIKSDVQPVPVGLAIDAEVKSKRTVKDVKPCSQCGMMAKRDGTCYKCDNCGSTTGCTG